MEKEISVWSQAKIIMKGMNIGESQRMYIPADKIDSVRAVSYRIGKFSFVALGDGQWQITRREPKEARSLRAKVRAALSQNAGSVFFPAATTAEVINVRSYTKQHDDAAGTVHRCVEADGGVWVMRDMATEACRPLLAALNNPDSTAEEIDAALAGVSALCEHEKVGRLFG